MHRDVKPLTYRTNDGSVLHAVRVGSIEPGGPGAPDPVVLLHGGGPDHQSLIPLAEALADLRPVILPDVRGYGRSVCRDPRRHTWSQYATDVIGLLDHMGVHRAIVGGAGLGTTISLRTALAYTERIEALLLISIEDIEGDQAKAAEIEFMDAFASRVRNGGIEAAWEPILPDLPPIIGAMVRDAIPRSDPESIAAAAAIGRDRSFRDVSELAPIAAPVVVFPGMDWRHPRAVAEDVCRTLRNGQLARVAMSEDIRTTGDFARAFAPPIREFLATLAS
jgi:pimeloyl-ACP methyl ester carboxylesterase